MYKKIDLLDPFQDLTISGYIKSKPLCPPACQTAAAVGTNLSPRVKRPETPIAKRQDKARHAKGKQERKADSAAPDVKDQSAPVVQTNSSAFLRLFVPNRSMDHVAQIAQLGEDSLHRAAPSGCTCCIVCYRLWHWRWHRIDPQRVARRFVVLLAWTVRLHAPSQASGDVLVAYIDVRRGQNV